jgi:hypothetical protein
VCNGVFLLHLRGIVKNPHARKMYEEACIVISNLIPLPLIFIRTQSVIFASRGSGEANCLYACFVFENLSLQVGEKCALLCPAERQPVVGDMAKFEAYWLPAIEYLFHEVRGQEAYRQDLAHVRIGEFELCH